MSKILIIKSGHSETWIDDQSEIVSFGDVFRSTTLLKNFLNDDLVWVGSAITAKLIDCDHFDFRELNELTLRDLEWKSFDTIINLEKSSLLKTHNLITHPRFLGFFYDHASSQWKLQSSDQKFYSLTEWLDHCHQLGIKTWGQKLQHLIGSSLTDGLGLLRPHSSGPLCDFGLNWQVGKKWPEKQIGAEKWEWIHQQLSKEHSVSWQQGFDSLSEYKEWVQSCRVLLTHDSLGMHLALALNMPVLALFTVTKPDDIDTNPHSLLYFAEKSHIDFNFIVDNAITLLNESKNQASRKL